MALLPMLLLFSVGSCDFLDVIKLKPCRKLTNYHRQNEVIKRVN